MEEPKYIRVSLKNAITLLQEKHYTNPNIGKKLGVSSLQVHYYHRGKTKRPSAIVCMKLFNNFKINGDHILLDLYKDYEEMESHYKIVREASGKDKQGA